MPMKVGLLLVVSVVACSALLTNDQFSLRIRLYGYHEECAYLASESDKHAKIEVNYIVTTEGREVQFTFFGPNGDALIDETGKKNNFRMDISEHGDYKICAKNTGYIGTYVVLTAYMIDSNGHVGNKYKKINNPQLDVTIDNFDVSTMKLRDQLDKYTKLAESRSLYLSIDRSTMENNFEMINRWAAINTFVMVFAAVVQVVLIRSLFTDGSIGRVIRSGNLFK